MEIQVSGLIRCHRGRRFSTPSRLTAATTVKFKQRLFTLILNKQLLYSIDLVNMRETDS